MKKILFLCLLIFTTLAHSSGIRPVLDLSLPHQKIGNSLYVFEDTGGKMSFEQVKNLSPDPFIPLNNQVDAHLFTTSAFWYRFTVDNHESNPVARIVVFGIPWLDHITMTVVDQNGTQSYEGGDTLPYTKRAINNHLPNFEHRFAPGASTVYVQIKTRDPFIVPISVIDRFAFLEEAADHSNHTGFIYGILAAMLFYNLFLFVSIKARYYAFYVLYLIVFLVMNASYNCYTFEWLFYDRPILQNWAESTTIFLFSIAGLLFARSFLNLKSYFPVLYRITNTLILFYTAMMAVTSLFGYHYHVAFAIALSVVFSLYVFIIAWYALFKGYRYARFFLLGTSAGLIGTSITSLTVMALLPYSDIGFRAVDYGMVTDAILLSLALAERVKITQEEKLTAEKEAKTDVMTGLLNRRAYAEIALTEVRRCQRYGGKLALIMMDIDHFKAVNDTYGHAAGDKVLQEIADILKNILRDNDYVFRFGGEEFMILLPESDIKHAKHLAERIRKAVEKMRVLFEEHTISATVSMGIAEYDKNDLTIKDVEKRADEALYTAKGGGRNQSIVAV